MSALTPDEEAELAELTRALFAPGGRNDAAARARFAELDQRRRDAAQLPKEAPEPVLAAPAMVPEPPAHVSEEATEPRVGVSDERHVHEKRTQLHPKRTRVLSAVVGFAVAAGVTVCAQWAVTSRPIATGTAVEISVDDMPGRDDQRYESLLMALTNDPGSRVFEVDVLPGMSIIVSESSNDVTCVYLSAIAKPTQDPISECHTGDGALVMDFPMALMRDGAWPQTLAAADMHRLVYRNGEMTVWNRPSTDQEDY